jgi:predicted ArsR family transcriptional regulator
MFSGYNTPMNTVRLRVLEYIRSHRSVTAADLSQAFRMSQANARHHLSILTKQGLIQVIDSRQNPGKGRPSRVFAPSEPALGNNLDILASSLMELLQESPLAQGGEEYLDQLAPLMANKMKAYSEASESHKSLLNLTGRLNRLTQILNQSHYESRWEAHHDAPRLILGHCPYAAILGDHPELCRMDTALIENLVRSPAELLARLTKDVTGLPHCILRISK